MLPQGTFEFIGYIRWYLRPYSPVVFDSSRVFSIAIYTTVGNFSGGSLPHWIEALIVVRSNQVHAVERECECQYCSGYRADSYFFCVCVGGGGGGRAHSISCAIHV